MENIEKKHGKKEKKESKERKREKRKTNSKGKYANKCSKTRLRKISRVSYHEEIFLQKSVSLFHRHGQL